MNRVRHQTTESVLHWSSRFELTIPDQNLAPQMPNTTNITISEGTKCYRRLGLLARSGSARIAGVDVSKSRR